MTRPATKLGRCRCGCSYPGQLVLLRVQGGGWFSGLRRPPAGHPILDALGRSPARYLPAYRRPPPEIVIRLDKPYDAAPLLSRDIAVDRCQRRRADSPSPACALLLVERLAGAGTVTMRNKRVGRGTAVSDAEPMHGTARRREAYMQSRRSPDISELINRELAR